MTETSFPWDGTTLGHATEAPYSAAEFADFFSYAIGRHSVAPFQRSWIVNSTVPLGLVSGTSSPLTVNDGFAVVAGHMVSWSGETVTVPTPAANPRIDRIVLRVDWAAQTVTVERLAGTEAASPSPPALTQSDGVLWEVSLAQARITTGGVITVSDERPGFIGLGQSALFRDLSGREYEEFFDHFHIGTGTSTALNSQFMGWQAALTGTGAATFLATPPSAVQLTSGATAVGVAEMYRGNATGTNFFPTEIAQAPLLLESRFAVTTAVDAAAIVEMRLIDSAGTSFICLGVHGPTSASSYVLRAAAGGAAVTLNTGVAIDTSYHKFGIYVPASGGPAQVFIDGVAKGAIATLPAATTDLRAVWIAANGATAAARTMQVDWARLVRGS